MAVKQSPNSEKEKGLSQEEELFLSSQEIDAQQVHQIDDQGEIKLSRRKKNERAGSRALKFESKGIQTSGIANRQASSTLRA